MTRTPDAARINETVTGLREAHERRRKRASTPSAVPQFRTLNDGSVMNQAGQIIYRPAVQRKGTT
jgi:hypothetical protein